MDRKNVLIISGKDQKLTGDIHHFLRTIGLYPVDLESKLPGGISDPYKALQTAIYAACAIVVILTGDDEARLQQQWYICDDDNEDELKSYPQPRLNVLFAAGFAFAKRPKKILVVKRGRIRLCRYFEGPCLVDLDDTYDKRNTFIQMLRGVGCEVDDSRKKWVDVGDFSDPES